MLTAATALSDGEIFGVVRLMADPDNESAEFAIMLRPELSGQGGWAATDGAADRPCPRPRHRPALR